MGRYMMMDGFLQNALSDFLRSEDGVVSEAQHAHALQKVGRAQGETSFTENLVFGFGRLVLEHEELRKLEGTFMIAKALGQISEAMKGWPRGLAERMTAGGKPSLDQVEKLLRNMEQQLSPEQQPLLQALRGVPRETQTRALEQIEKVLSGKPTMEDWKQVRQLIQADGKHLVEHGQGLMRSLAAGYRPDETEVFELEKRFRQVLRSSDIPPETARWVSGQLEGVMQMRGLMMAHDPLSPQLQQSIERRYQLGNFGVGYPSVNGPAAGTGVMTMTIPVSFHLTDPQAPGGRRRHTAVIEVTGVEGPDAVNVPGLSKSFVPERVRVILSDALQFDLGRQAQQAGLSASALTQNRVQAILGALESAIEGDPNGALNLALAATPQGRLALAVRTALESLGVDTEEIGGISRNSARSFAEEKRNAPRRPSGGMSLA